MANDLGEQQGTVAGFQRATKRPTKLEAFLRRYADRHGFEINALLDTWELVPRSESSAATVARPRRAISRSVQLTSREVNASVIATELITVLVSKVPGEEDRLGELSR